LLIRIGEFDRLALQALVLRRRPTLDRVLGRLTHLGDAVVTIAAAAGLLLLTGPDLRPAGLEAAFALLTSHIAVQLLKRTVARPRPRLPSGISTLVAAPDRFSFPSGHAAASLSVALPLAMALPAPAGFSVLTLATTVGLSRVYLGVHYPGDVLMGWALAVLAVTTAPFAMAALGLALLGLL
jgi:undecaprenyl-diphosphatase